MCKTVVMIRPTITASTSSTLNRQRSRHNRRRRRCARRQVKTGSGVVNSLINKLPVEVHIPGYNYCGPGTKLADRLKRGDVGVNALDNACKDHDIAYSQNKDDLSKRHEADRILEQRAWKRVLARDSSIGEKAAAWGVANAMKLKQKLGMGVSDKTTASSSFGRVTKAARLAINKSKVRQRHHHRHDGDLTDKNVGKNAIKLALKAARLEVRKDKQKNEHNSVAFCNNYKRVIPVPKIGGILPLIPIFAGLSALGALTGGAAAVTKAVINANDAKKQLEENKRHNRTMEAIAIGKGLHMRPYRKGYGLYMSPFPKNH